MKRKQGALNYVPWLLSTMKSGTPTPLSIVFVFGHIHLFAASDSEINKVLFENKISVEERTVWLALEI